MRPHDLDSIFQFSTKDLDQDRLQKEGVAGLWNILNQRISSAEPQRGFSYLADEVGLGKTLQGLGLIALHLRENPGNTAVVIAPKAIQNNWMAEWELLMSKIYQPDGYLLHQVHEQKIAAVRPLFCNNLEEFANAWYSGQSRLLVLRYSSFRLPLRFGIRDKKKTSNVDMLQKLHNMCALIGVQLNEEARNKILDAEDCLGDVNRIWVEVLSAMVSAKHPQLHHKYGNLLLCCDECQWLRNAARKNESQQNNQNRNIHAVFSQSTSRWLFISATPWHSGKGDLQSLEYFVTNSSELKGLRNASSTPEELRRRVKPWMIRRQRVLHLEQRRLRKHEYRHLKKVPVEMYGSPFHALTMLLVQKKLCEVLENSKMHGGIRSGELSSFESLKRSLRNSQGNEKSTDDAEIDSNGPDSSHTVGRDAAGAPMDASFLDHLQNSFCEQLKPNSRHAHLPHAKMDELIAILRECIWGSDKCEKALVFVRRVDTVKEIGVRLVQVEHAEELRKRIEGWQSLHATGGILGIKPKGIFPEVDSFWKIETSTTPKDLDDSKATPQPNAEDDSDAHLTNDFIRATRKGGFLFNFRNALLRPDESKNPLSRLCLTKSAEYTDRWQVALGIKMPDLAHYELLARAVLMAMRNSDFLLDLHMLHKYFDGRLDENLLKLFEVTPQLVSTETTRSLVNHWKRTRRLLQKYWDQWDVLLEKCFDSQTMAHTKVDAVMNSLLPLVWYSGGVKTTHADARFRLPGAPHVLVCTDKYKEGVNLHLNCDKVIHYGLPQSSGDLEQRVGRVDRFECLYGRRLTDWKTRKPNENDQKYPKLKVEFPFLKGTLDEIQCHARFRDADHAARFMDGVGFSTLHEAVLGLESSTKSETRMDVILIPEFIDVPAKPKFLKSSNEAFLQVQLDNSKAVFQVFNGVNEQPFGICYTGIRSKDGGKLQISCATYASAFPPSVQQAEIFPHNFLDMYIFGAQADLLSRNLMRWSIDFPTLWASNQLDPIAWANTKSKLHLYLAVHQDSLTLCAPAFQRQHSSPNEIHYALHNQRRGFGLFEYIGGMAFYRIHVQSRFLSEKELESLAVEFARNVLLTEPKSTPSELQSTYWETPNFIFAFKD